MRGWWIVESMEDVDEDRRCTYKEMASEIVSLGNSLNLHGVFKG